MTGAAGMPGMDGTRPLLRADVAESRSRTSDVIGRQTCQDRLNSAA